MKKIAIKGTGSYSPERVVPNSYFDKIIDTSDEWITTRTGIKERRMIEKGQGRGAGGDPGLPRLQAGLPGSEGREQPGQDGPVEVGGSRLVVAAGPCAVESETQILKTARAVKKAGATFLRGGAYKPRTSPYDFQGLAEEGLRLLVMAREETGLPIVTKVMSPDTVGLVAEPADLLQIGARNMQNFDLLREVGKSRKPVLLKRGMSATLEEFLAAAEYILAEGNPHVILSPAEQKQRPLRSARDRPFLRTSEGPGGVDPAT